MSIRGIDTQIMITRSADLARETSAAQNNPRFSQDFMAAQNIRDSAENQSRVLATDEAILEEMKPDSEGSGSGAAGGEGRERGEEELTEEQQKELLVAPADHDYIIDIMA